MLHFLIWVILSQLIFQVFSTTNEYTYRNTIFRNQKTLHSFFKVHPSVNDWIDIDVAGKFTILTMHVDHHQESNWHVNSLHDIGSIGWNRTQTQEGIHRPYACTLKFFGTALESNMANFLHGGTGYLSVSYKLPNEKKVWWGYDKEEEKKLHCYYMTNKDRGSEFIDTPKTLGIAIYCPISLDQEIGQYEFRKTMEFGRVCRPFAEYHVSGELFLRPTLFPNSSNEEVISASFNTFPSSKRVLQYNKLQVHDPRVHAVCTVQTFRNPYSGPYLYMFIKYYQLMGWRVIVYDRFGYHYEFVKDLLHLTGVDYYPFTVLQLVEPKKYNQEYIQKMGFDMKTFYDKEVRWGYSSKKLADTADQDADKTRTYDYARIEYAQYKTMLYVDSDELFFCPKITDSLAGQRGYQMMIHDEYHAQGIEEMRYVRLPYSGFLPPMIEVTNDTYNQVDLTNSTGHCMLNAFEKKSLLEYMKCWSGATSFDAFPKSADLSGTCPFHYNHWSCDGMRSGGRDFTKLRCRCKVSFELQNGITYQSYPKKCHLMHLNHNKYRIESKLSKKSQDKGDQKELNPLYLFLKDHYDENHKIIN